MTEQGGGEPDLGTVIGGCRLIRVIGRGGMGVVYLAEQEALRRQVAVKVIAPEFARDPAFRRRFERESRLAASIEHPNVVPVYAAGEEDGRLFIVMRFVPGTDLRVVLAEEGALSPGRSVEIAAAVAAGLDVAHRAGLVHRDVKPANVLLAPESGGQCAYLTDFGLTKEAASDSAVTASGQWVGTVDYIAPEQLEHGHVDARADVYALGCVLFEMLSGATPYSGSAVQKMWAHVNLPPPSLSEAAPAAAALDPVVRQAMAKEPADRFQSAGALAEAATRAASATAEARTRVLSSSRPVRRAVERTRRSALVRLVLPGIALLAAAALTVALLSSGGGDDDSDPGRTAVGSHVRGTNGDDSLVAGPGADRVEGLRGDDEIDGGRGPDDLIAGPGADVILDSDDNAVDRIRCGADRDLVAKPDSRDILASDCELAGWSARATDGAYADRIRVTPRVARQRVSFEMRCRARCEGTLELRAPTSRRLLGLGSFQLRPGRWGRATAVLNSVGLEHLRQRRRVRVVIRGRLDCRCPDPPPLVTSGLTTRFEDQPPRRKR